MWGIQGRCKPGSHGANGAVAERAENPGLASSAFQHRSQLVSTNRRRLGAGNPLQQTRVHKQIRIRKARLVGSYEFILEPVFKDFPGIIQFPARHSGAGRNLAPSTHQPGGNIWAPAFAGATNKPPQGPSTLLTQALGVVIYRAVSPCVRPPNPLRQFTLYTPNRYRPYPKSSHGCHKVKQRTPFGTRR